MSGDHGPSGEKHSMEIVHLNASNRNTVDDVDRVNVQSVVLLVPCLGGDRFPVESSGNSVRTNNTTDTNVVVITSRVSSSVNGVRTLIRAIDVSPETKGTGEFSHAVCNVLANCSELGNLWVNVSVCVH